MSGRDGDTGRVGMPGIFSDGSIDIKHPIVIRYIYDLYNITQVWPGASRQYLRIYPFLFTVTKYIKIMK